ncbi:MAG: hypothetical protein Q9157_003558 [Trypethelium eluteriae]
MGAGASTVVSPAPHPPQQSTSVVPYVGRSHEPNREPNCSQELNRHGMASPLVYQPVPAPSGGILNPYDIAPWYAAYARGMFPRRTFGPWSGAGMAFGGVDWESVPPLARMMVDVRVRDDEDDGRERGRRRSRKERGRDGDRGRGRDWDRDRARGDRRHRSRSRHWSRGRSRGGWYSGDEGRSRGRWWSRSRGRDGYDRMERRRKGRRGRSENWRKARGEDAYEEFDEGEYDEELDQDDEFYDAGMRHGRGGWGGGKRQMLARGGKGKKKGKQLPPWATDPFLHVADPVARNTFRRMSERIDGMDGRLVNLEDYLRAREEAGMGPSRENPRFPMRYGGRDFAGEDEFDFGGRGTGRAGGVMGGRRPGMPPRGPPLGRGRGPLNEFDDGGMDMGFGDMDDEATQMNTASDKLYPSDRVGTEARNPNQDYPGGDNTGDPRRASFERAAENTGPWPPEQSPQRQSPHQERPASPRNFRPRPPPGNEPVPPPPPPPGGFRGGPPGDYGAQRPQTPRPPPGTGPEGMRQDPEMRDDPGEGPSFNPDVRNIRQTWRDDLRGEDVGPPLD